MDGLQVQWLLERGSEDQVDMAAVMQDALALYLVEPHLVDPQRPGGTGD